MPVRVGEIQPRGGVAKPVNRKRRKMTQNQTELIPMNGFCELNYLWGSVRQVQQKRMDGAVAWWIK
jgi:hypothetical protein